MVSVPSHEPLAGEGLSMQQLSNELVRKAKYTFAFQRLHTALHMAPWPSPQPPLSNYKLSMIGYAAAHLAYSEHLRGRKDPHLAFV